MSCKVKKFESGKKRTPLLHHRTADKKNCDLSRLTARFGKCNYRARTRMTNNNPNPSMNEPTIFQTKDITGNPAPLGLLGFGMTTVLLNFANAGCYELNSMVLAMGLCYGCIAQVIAGIMEWKKGNTFATTAFISYGFFWLSFVTLVLLPKIIPTVSATNATAVAIFLSIWGLFTAVMFVGTFRLNRALQFVFGTLTILFILLAYADFTGASADFRHFTGYEGLVCGFSAIYTGLAQVLNELYGRTVLPLGPVKK